MKKISALFVLMIVLSLSACTPQMTVAPTSLPATAPARPVDTATSAPVLPTEIDPTPAAKTYTNSAFGLKFQYPSNWYGPDEYISDQTLRVAVGSDVVYPYGTGITEQVYTASNSYYVTLQYTKNNQNEYWKDTYQSLVDMKDGESLSGVRGRIIRVRQLELGKFKGYEYIATLSDTAQTEPVYSREVILIDDQSNLLTIMGTPNNVDLSNGANWRVVYRMVDEANMSLFHQVVESITVE